MLHISTSSLVGDNSKSWGEMVKNIETSKRTLPWNEYQRPKTMSLFDRKVKERELDPVAMQYRNPQQEQNYQSIKQEKQQQLVGKVTMNRSQKFDILSHENGPPRKIDIINQTRDIPKVGNNRGRHIISGLKFEDYEKVTTLYNEEFMLSKLPKGKPIPSTNKRDFNLINNQFFENHQEKIKQDYDHMKEHILDKYWKTHDYDIVKGEYCDFGKEVNYQNTLKMNETTQGLAQESRLPPTTKYSEGNSYNILNHEILDETKFKIAMKSMFQAANRQTSSAILAKQKQEGELRVDINEQRKMNRVSYKRWEQEIDRGYNFINTTNELHVPKAARPATVWSKVHTSNPPQNSISTSNQDESRSSNKAVISPRNLAVDNNRASTSIGTSRIVNNNKPSAALTRNIPSLDLTKTEQPPSVRYNEPTSGPTSQKIVINPVRTGGFH